MTIVASSPIDTQGSITDGVPRPWNGLRLWDDEQGTWSPDWLRRRSEQARKGRRPSTITIR